MRITSSRWTPRFWRKLSFRHLTTMVLIAVVMVGDMTACDVCLRLPGIPFEVDHPAAIEVAMATQDAAELGQIEWNPVIRKSLATNHYSPLRLEKVSPHDLVKFWAQTCPSRFHPTLRFTLELIFVDADRICHLDIRFGDVLDGDPENGPANVRVFTTKAGFYRLIEDGLDSCEQRKLVAVELADAEERDELRQLFSIPSKSKNSDVISAL